MPDVRAVPCLTGPTEPWRPRAAGRQGLVGRRQTQGFAPAQDRVGSCGILTEQQPNEVPMPLPAEDLEMQALSLPPEDRARLLERLIASFEPKSPAQAAWMQLAQRRREDVRAGRTAMVPGDEALERVKARLA